MKNKDQLLHQIAQLFSQADYEKISIRDISKALNITKAGLYYHFASKQEMLFKIIDGYMERVLADVREKMAVTYDPEEKLFYVIERYIQFFVKYPAENKVIISEIHSLEPRYGKILREKEMEYYGIVKQIMGELIKKHKSKINTKVAVFCLMGSLNWIVRWYKPDGKVSPQHLAKNILALFIKGIGG